MTSNPITKKKKNPGSASSSTLKNTNGTSYNVQYLNGAQRTVNKRQPYYPPGYTPGGISGAVSTRPNTHQKITADNNFGQATSTATASAKKSGGNGINGTPATFTPSAFNYNPVQNNYTPTQYNSTPITSNYNPSQGTYTPVSSGYQAQQYNYTPIQNAMTPDMAQYDVRDYNIRARDNQYAQQMNDAINKLNNIGDFSYNQKNDPLYNQYAEMYQRNAKLAMQDTMGQAAALTGGYGSSYAETAGQAMYNQQMNQLNDKALELYNASLNAYNTNLNKAAQQASTMMQAYGLDQSAIQQELDTAFQNANLNESQRQYATQLMMNWAAEQNAVNQFNSANDMQAFFNNEQNRQQAAEMALQADQFNASQAYDYWSANEANRRAAAEMQLQADQYNASQAFDAWNANETNRRAAEQMNIDAQNANNSLAYDYWNATNNFGQRANEQSWQNYWNNRDYQYKQQSMDADNAYRYAALAQDADQYAQDNAYKYATLQQNADQYAGDDAFRYAQLRETQRQNEADNIYRQQALQQDADQYNSDYWYRERQLEQNQKQFDTEMDYKDKALKQDNKQFNKKYNYDKAVADAKAEEAAGKKRTVSSVKWDNLSNEDKKAIASGTGHTYPYTTVMDQMNARNSDYERTVYLRQLYTEKKIDEQALDKLAELYGLV